MFLDWKQHALMVKKAFGIDGDKAVWLRYGGNG